MPRKRQRSLRTRLRELLEPYEPLCAHPRASATVDLVILSAILVSCALILVEYTIDYEGHPELHQLLWYAEIGFTTLFTVEYLLRWYAAPRRWSYPFGFFAIIDLFAVLPSLLLLAHVMFLSPDLLALRVVRATRLLRALRFLRLFRVLKFLRHGPLLYRGLLELRIRAGAVHDKFRLGHLGRLAVWVLVAWVIGANLVYLTELGLADGPSPYAEYWRSYWNVVIVLFSGMDAESPVTLLGRIEVLLILVGGLCGVGMLTAEIVSILVRMGQRSGRIALLPPHVKLARHIVILGRNAHLDNVIRQVQAALGGRHYLLVVDPAADTLPARDPKAYRRVFALPGDPARADVLARAALPRASRVIVLSPEDESRDRDRDNQALMRAVAATGRNRDVPLVVELRQAESLRYAETLPAAECLVGRPFGARLLSQAVLHPGVTALYDELLTFTDASSELYVVPVPTALVGQTFTAVQLHFLDRDDDPVVPVGVAHPAARGAIQEIWLQPEGGAEEQTLDADDRLIVMAYERPPLGGADREEQWSGTFLAR